MDRMAPPPFGNDGIGASTGVGPWADARGANTGRVPFQGCSGEPEDEAPPLEPDSAATPPPSARAPPPRGS